MEIPVYCQNTGDWSFTTISDDEILNGWTGKVSIRENPDKNAHGFMKSFGNKWGWEGTEEAFVPQYVMGKYLEGLSHGRFYYQYKYD
jgi:hypothetical protein